MTFRFHPSAGRDLRDTLEWYQGRSPRAASSFFAAIHQTTNLIRVFPDLFPTTSLGCRKALLGKFPQSLIYLVHDDSITIVAIAHAKQQDAFWHDRVTQE